MQPKLRECDNPECSKTFTQYNSLNKWCSYSCKKKCGKAKSPSKMSAKRKVESKLYSELRIQFLSNPKNQICPITGKPTTDIHHKRGRRGSLFLDTTYWVALSREGHEYVENNPEWAYENGYSLKRNHL